LRLGGEEALGEGERDDASMPWGYFFEEFSGKKKADRGVAGQN